jgi:DNA-binding NtrC family response regulator
MELIEELKRLKFSLKCHPLTPVIKHFNSDTIISDTEYITTIVEINKNIKEEIIRFEKEEEERKGRKEEKNGVEIKHKHIVLYSMELAEKPILKTINERPFHHLRMLLKSLDADLLNENSFSDFIHEEILKGRTKEEQEKNIIKAQNILNTLAMYSEYITPIKEEINEHKEISVKTNIDDTYWTTAHTARVLGVERKTLYNWLKESDFALDKGRLNIQKLEIYLKNKNPKYLSKLQCYLN